MNMRAVNQGGRTLPAGVFELADRAQVLRDQLSRRAHSLWAKTGDETGWLSLPQHLMDSACAAAVIWDVWVADSVKGALCRLTGLSLTEVRTLYVWMAGSHDLGKATLTFARQIEATVEGEAFVSRIADSGLPTGKGVHEQGMAKFPHALGSRIIIRDWLKRQGVPTRAAISLATVADAHHGIPSEIGLRRAAQDALSDYPESWREVHEELLDLAAELSGITEVLPKLQGRFSAAGLQLLTGLVIMADWISSSAEAFPMTMRGTQAERVERGMQFIELTAPWSAGELDAKDIDTYLQASFDWPSHYRARPIQRAVVEALEAVDGSSLVIIEAPTGEGKTEAALAAAQKIAADSGAQGVVFAAPTMSTADGLFDRVVTWARHNTPGAEIASMFLAHSKSGLSEPFRKLKLAPIGDEGYSSSGQGVRPHVGQVVANQWLSGRKKGILSNFVVATVDQVLQMALQSRHSMLRHVGLAGKVVVIDEVHAYDAYMSEYLATALKWLACYDASVILMSATLPVKQKSQLAAAYGGELSNNPIVANSTAYPLITTVSEAGVLEREVAPRPVDLHARVELIDDDIEELLEQLRQRTTQGGCVLVVCNTVRRAQGVYQVLSEEFPEEVELHHAAFMANERVEKESRLRAKLGPDSHRGNGRPDRRFIVATQVAEQSLDIDADLLVSDIAPMDLLIQRIGRIHRHSRPDSDRPEKLREPQVLIRGIISRDPVPDFESGTAFIYNPKILLATLAVLEQQILTEGFRRPDDIAPLVHAAYGQDPNIPAAWHEAWEEAKAESEKNRIEAAQRAATFRFPPPRMAAKLDQLFESRFRDPNTKKGEEAGQAQVRDADPSIEVIPIIDTAYGYLPLAAGYSEEFPDDAVPERNLAWDLASSTVRLPARFGRYESVFERAIDQLELETPVGWAQHYLLRGQVALRLDENREIELAGYRLRYTSELGLETLEEGEF